jgi:hypothetical protein
MSIHANQRELVKLGAGIYEKGEFSIEEGDNMRFSGEILMAEASKSKVKKS